MQRRTCRKSKVQLNAPLWVCATGKRYTRIKKARTYLKGHAWVPTSSDGRRRALFVVACNLRLYHQLPIDLAVALIRQHFNPRIVGMDGGPTPYLEQEIRHKYRRAGLPNMYPSLGVNDPKAKRKVVALALKKEIRNFLRKWTAPGGSCTPGTLLQTFIASRGGEAVNRIVFGRAVVAATGIGRSTPFGVPTYKGFHIKGSGDAQGNAA